MHVPVACLSRADEKYHIVSHTAEDMDSLSWTKELPSREGRVRLPAQTIRSPLFGNSQILGGKGGKPHTRDVIKVGQSRARGKLADRPMARAAGTMAPCLSTTSGVYLLLCTSYDG